MKYINQNISDTYRKLVRYIKESKILHHTYQLKEENAYRGVIPLPKNLKNLLLQKEDFKWQRYNTELLLVTFGYTIIIQLLYNFGYKTPLQIFYVDLKCAKNNKNF